MPRRSPRSTLFPYTTLFRSATLGRTRGNQTPGRTARTETSGVSLRADPGSCGDRVGKPVAPIDRKSTRLNSSHANNSYDAFCLEKNTAEGRDAALVPDDLVV